MSRPLPPSEVSGENLLRKEVGYRHFIRLYRNTHNAQGKPDKFPHEDSRGVWKKYGLIGHMLNHQIGKSPQSLYTELEAYRQDSIEEYPKPEDLQELDLAFFFEGLAELLKEGFIRAEVETVPWPSHQSREKREFNSRRAGA